jgi:hypothetical protein
MGRERAIAAWLSKKTTGMTGWLLLGSLGQFLFALAVLFVTFWIIYAVIWLGFNWLVPIAHVTRMWISLAVLALLFVGNATTDRAYLQKYSFTTGTFNEEPVSFYVPGVGLGSTINPLAPESVHSYAKMVTNALYLGPRLVTGSFRMLARALRLRGIDREGCAAALTFLMKQDARVPFKEVAEAIPSGHDVCAVFEQLHEFDGVMFLKSKPAGLSLLSDFREELRSLKK